MFKQTVRPLLLALSLATATASAYAGATISDRRYWPNEARQSADGLLLPQPRWGSAFGSIANVPDYSFAQPADPGRRAFRHQRARNPR